MFELFGLPVINFLIEFFFVPGIEEQLFVDTTRGAKLKINLDIVFPKIGCDFLSLDAQDVSGEQHIAIGKFYFIFKIKLRSFCLKLLFSLE